MSALRLRLIVTGQMEEKAMAAPLQTHWATLHPTPLEIQTTRTDPFNCSTLRPNAPPNGPMKKAASLLLDALVDGGPAAPAADLVLLVEDVELANLGQEAGVVDHLTRALIDALAEPGWATHPQIRGLLATRAALLLSLIHI